MSVDMTNARLQPISWLAAQTGEAIDYDELRRQEASARRLHDDFNVLPTLGCEVEVKWSTLFPELAEEYFGAVDALGGYAIKYADLPVDKQASLDETCVALDAVWKPRYEATAGAGIPVGNDAYWEFAHNPTYSWQAQAKEIELLMKDGLIPQNSQHSLHITLGGVKTEGGGSSLVLSGLELACGTPERIRLATKPSKLGTSSAWARRGNDGERHRAANFLKLGQQDATEFRTLAASTPEATARTLYTAQMLGAILLAYRQREKPSSPVVGEIGQLWPQFRSTLKELWAERGLPAESWGPPHQKPASWLAWADCIAARDILGTMENETVCYIEEVTALAEAGLANL